MDGLEHIIAGCLKNNPSAQRKLFDHYAPILLGICFRYSSCKDDAEEILQQAFIKIFSKLETFEHQGSFEGWMKRITVNTALNFVNRSQRTLFTEEVNEVEIAFGDEPDEALIREMENERLFRCISQLPDGYRLVINLFAIEGLSHKEIGEKLGITESTSRSQFARAKSALKKLLENELQQDNMYHGGKTIRYTA